MSDIPEHKLRSDRQRTPEFAGDLSFKSKHNVRRCLTEIGVDNAIITVDV